MAAITICSDFGAPQNKVRKQHLELDMEQQTGSK